MSAVRAGLLVLYLVGTYFLSNYLRKRLSDLRDAPLSSGTEIWQALFRVWGPTLWMFPGVLWIGLLDLHWLEILALCALLPLSMLALFLVLTGVFTANKSSPQSMLAVVTVGMAVLAALIAVVSLVCSPKISLFQTVLFCAASIVPPLISILFLLFWAADVVLLPQDVDKPVRTALALILGYFAGSPRPSWVVEDGKIHTRIRGNAFGGIGPGLLVTEPENVVVLRSGPTITRVAGPGVVLTRKAENPFRVVDLRNQIRSTQVRAITRDGIEVQMPVYVLFRIARGNKDLELGAGWPYRTQRDVLQALFSEEVDPSGRSPLDAHAAHPWEDLPVTTTAHKVEQVISFYSLDQLHEGISDPQAAELVDDPQHQLLVTHRRAEAALGLTESGTLGDPLARLTIGKLVTRSVREALRPRGLEVLECGIEQVPEPLNRGVTEQRVDVWKSRFITKVMDWQASIERQRYKAMGKIRQQARETMLAEMIEETGRRLEIADPTLQRDFVAYHLLDSLIRIAQSPEVQAMLPETALPTLEYVHQQISEDEALGGES